MTSRSLDPAQKGGTHPLCDLLGHEAGSLPGELTIAGGMALRGWSRTLRPGGAAALNFSLSLN